jgi:hypothetical protein
LADYSEYKGSDGEESSDVEDPLKKFFKEIDA